MEVLVGFLLFWMLLGLIPASIAQGKGRSFAAWWIYGTLLWIIALIHALVLQDPKKEAQDALLLRTMRDVAAAKPAPQADPAAELSRWADLRDRGVITSEEFESRKAKILNA